MAICVIFGGQRGTTMHSARRVLMQTLWKATKRQARLVRLEPKQDRAGDLSLTSVSVPNVCVHTGSGTAGSAAASCCQDSEL